MPAAVSTSPQAPRLHDRCWHSVSCPGQSVATRHCTQAPAPLHSTPPLWVQAPPAATGGVEGVPPVHMAVTHWLVLTGMSLLSTAFTMWPAPSHWFWWQSPGVCAVVCLPAGANEKPHMPVVQVRVWHSVSVPGQSPAATQPTHIPPALQRRPFPQLVPAVTGGLEGTPLVHTAVVQGLLLVGRSVSSTTSVMLPAPSHSLLWQSPAVCADVGVPAATNTVPHTPSVHVAVTHSLGPGGQSASVVQPASAPASVAPPPAPLLLLLVVVVVVVVVVVLLLVVLLPPVPVPLLLLVVVALLLLVVVPLLLLVRCRCCSLVVGAAAAAGARAAAGAAGAAGASRGGGRGQADAAAGPPAGAAAAPSGRSGRA